jgi:hypothetical protein
MSENSKPASRKAGFGAIPKPTVKSGWEKVEVLQAFKKCYIFECLLGVPSFELSPSSPWFEGFSIHRYILFAEPFFFEVDLKKERGRK